MWGKVGSDKYLAMIGWDKICTAIEEGGLGVRDFRVFNEALLLKVVWQVASNADKLWVQVMQAKYFSRGGFWAVTNTRDASPLWRAIQRLKPRIKDSLMWHVGDGTRIAAINQPWHQNWGLQRITTNEHRDMKVADLYDKELQTWDATRVIQILGTGAMQHISQAGIQPSTEPLIPDRLTWGKGKNGNYTAKEGYKELIKEREISIQYNPNQVEAWGRIWGWTGLMPKVRTFLWKAVHGGLPTMGELSRRIRAINPTCPRCGMENEYLTHTLFFCSAARATWFVSPLAIRVNHIHMEFTQALLDLTRDMDENQIIITCNLLWNIWKARNKEVFTATKEQPQVTLRKAQLMEIPAGLEHLSRAHAYQPRIQPFNIPKDNMVILIDGSWDNTKKAGWGLTLYDQQGRLVKMMADHMRVPDPLSAEAVAMLHALTYCQKPNQNATMEKVTIISDCKVLVKHIQSETIEGLPSWQAAEPVAACIRLAAISKEWTEIRHMGREGVRSPHKLANWSRMKQMRLSTTHIQDMRRGDEIELELDLSLFTFQ